MDIEEIYPRKVVEVDITPQQPGRHTFACTRWCGADHWRMRGVLEVEVADPSAEVAVSGLATAEPPLFQQLGLDIDAARPVVHDLPARQPSAARGASLGITLPPELADPARRRTLAPVDLFYQSRTDANTRTLSDDELWDLVAWAWLRDADPGEQARAETLYARDCAACHGSTGNGDGPAGSNLPGMQKMDPRMPSGPADFTDPDRMLSASDVVLQGKLLRGGMGTGRPEFGSLYTDDERWAMVSHIRAFLFGK